MRKILAVIYIIVAAIILLGAGLHLYDRWGPQPRPQPMPELAAVKHPLEVQTYALNPSPTPLTTEDMVQEFRRVIATAEPFTWNEIPIKDKTVTKMIFQVPGGAIETKSFEIWKWFPEIMETDIFKPGKNTAVSYNDADDHYGLWLHSGYKQTMTPIQQWIERDDSGRLVPVEEADERIDSLVGSEVYFEMEPGVLRFATIVAGIRVPPGDVEELSGHPMDLLDYLSRRYPGGGFGELTDGITLSSRDVLYLYFCGLALPNESKNPEADKWTQARFVLALIPYQQQFDIRGVLE